MRVSVIGCGHVGLPTCLALAAIGHDVVGIDSDEGVVGALRSGVPTFYEPGLDQSLATALSAGKLTFTSEISGGVAGAEVAFICVGTPPRASGEANLAAVERAAREVAVHARGRVVVVEKSTVPAGTAERMRRTLLATRPDRAARFEVVSNPEFLREGSALKDALEPDRVLVGAESESAFKVMRSLYRPLIESGVRFVETDIRTAELAKHACNAFLALKISYANALARMCELSGADVVAIADVMGADARIGRAFLDAGIGYGGYCLPKDLQAFSRLAGGLGYPFPLLSEIERINLEAVEALVTKVKEAMWNLEDKRIAVFGLSFKPGTDDVRLSPAVSVAERLLDEGAEVVGCDPKALSRARAELPAIRPAADAYEAAAAADCIVVCTDWEEFRGLDMERIKSVMRTPVVVDGRNLFDPTEMTRAGFAYYPTGRPPSLPEWGRARALA